VHEVVGRIQQKAQLMLRELNLDAKATVGFAMTLSEICQNIVEHAGRGGWVMVQTYRWTKRLGRRVVVIAVADAGVGFRKSLETAPGKERGDRWDDAAALEDAVIRGVSRFRDPGRGQGLAGVRRYLGRWDGKLSVRSGTARIAIVPNWDDDVPLAEHLPPFPGAQVQVTIPERATPQPPPKGRTQR
jgi:anti-sigma regulatory factor (Ser/Thr protein kinase)